MAMMKRLSLLFLVLLAFNSVYSQDDAFLKIDVVADLVKCLQWKDVIFIYDTTFCECESSRYRQNLVRSFAYHNIEILTLRLSSSDPDVTDSVVSAMQGTSISSLILCIQPNKTSRLLKQAKQSNMLHQQYQWLIISMGSEMAELEEILNLDPSNIALIVPNTRSSDCISADVSHPAANSSVANINKISTKRSEPRGFITTVGHSYNFTIYSYDFKTRSFIPVASWTTASRLQGINNIICPDLFYNFNGATLTIATWEVTSGPINPIVIPVCFEVIPDENNVKTLNSYKLVEPPDGLFGGVDRNGNWNGMIGMLVHKEIYMAIGPFSIIPEREEVVDFTIPFMEDGGGILTKGGDPGPDPFNVFRPFPLRVWITIVGSTFVVAVLLYSIIRLLNWVFLSKTFNIVEEGDIQQQQRKRQTQSWTLGDCMMLVLGSVLQQDIPRYPECSSARLVIGCWWLFAILIGSIYTASLAALLAVRIKADTIDSIEELAASSVQPVTVAYTSWWTFFEGADSDWVGSTIFQRMVSGPMINTSEQGLALVHQQSMAFITDVNEARYLYGQDCNNLHVASSVFSKNGLGFAMLKHANYRDAVNSIILKLQEGGFMEAWKKKYWKTSPSCSNSGVTLNVDKQLPLRSISGIVLVYGIVALLSLLCFLLFWLKPRLPYWKKDVQRWTPREGAQSSNYTGSNDQRTDDLWRRAYCADFQASGDLEIGGRRCVFCRSGSSRFDDAKDGDDGWDSDEWKYHQ